MQRTLRQASLVQQVQAVAVVEAGRLGGGATGYTTGKITSLHSQIYAQLKSTFGEPSSAAVPGR